MYVYIYYIIYIYIYIHIIRKIYTELYRGNRGIFIAIFFGILASTFLTSKHGPVC